MKALLVTSDDFGMTLSVNEGIEQALRFGIVGSTNLMVPCPWFFDAVRRVRDNDFAVGIHLTLTSEWDNYRWRPLTNSARLRAVDGCMPAAVEQIPADISDGEIRAEFDAQLRELRRQGVEPTHVDTHMIASASSSSRELQVKRIVRQLCEDEGLFYTYDTDLQGRLRHFESETHCSPLSRGEFEQRLSELGDGVHHVVSHCAVDGPDLGALSANKNDWSREYRIKDFLMLTDAAFRRSLERRGFHLLSMRDFLAMRLCA